LTQVTGFVKYGRLPGPGLTEVNACALEAQDNGLEAMAGIGNVPLRRNLKLDVAKSLVRRCHPKAFGP